MVDGWDGSCFRGTIVLFWVSFWTEKTDILAARPDSEECYGEGVEEGTAGEVRGGAKAADSQGEALICVLYHLGYDV